MKPQYGTGLPRNSIVWRQSYDDIKLSVNDSSVVLTILCFRSLSIAGVSLHCPFVSSGSTVGARRVAHKTPRPFRPICSDLCYEACVLRDDRIRRHERDALRHRLCDENPIERVPMMRLEPFEREDVLMGDRQFEIPVI